MKDIKSLTKDHSGAVTVFLIVIFMALLMLAGLIIEGARIMVAERRVEGALQRAARSVLAGYDRDLVGEFGLYALHNSSKEQELRHYLQINLQERHINFQLIKYELDSAMVTVRDTGTLLNNDVFEKQVMEYMKYKAPVRITGTLVDKFKNIIGKRMELAQKGNTLVTERQTVLEKIETLNRQISAAAGPMDKKPAEAINNLGQLEDYRRELFDSAGSVMNQYEEAYRDVSISTKEYQDSTREKAGILADRGEADILRLASDKLKEDIGYNLVILHEIKELQDQLASEGERSGDLLDQKASQLRELQEIKIPQSDLTTLKPGEDTFAKEFRNLVLVIEKYNPSLRPEARLNTKDLKEAQETPSIEKSREDLKKMQEHEAEELGRSILAYMGNVVDSIINATIEKIYIVEYIMDKYTFVTSPTPRDHFFPVSEVEYILCGQDTQLANAAGGFEKVFLLRFGLNTIHKFITGALPHPLARLAEALVKGFIDALTDIGQLYGGNTINLYPGIPLTVGYGDHLRLLLVCQDRDTQLNRMRDLIQADLQKNKDSTGFQLKDCTTIIEAEATVKINLWFAPLLQLGKLGFTTFSDNKYTIHKQITVGY